MYAQTVIVIERVPVVGSQTYAHTHTHSHDRKRRAVLVGTSGGAQRSPVGKRSAARGELRSENWGHAQAHERLA